MRYLSVFVMAVLLAGSAKADIQSKSIQFMEYLVSAKECLLRGNPKDCMTDVVNIGTSLFAVELLTAANNLSMKGAGFGSFPIDIPKLLQMLVNLHNGLNNLAVDSSEQDKGSLSEEDEEDEESSSEEDAKVEEPLSEEDDKVEESLSEEDAKVEEPLSEEDEESLSEEDEESLSEEEGEGGVGGEGGEGGVGGEGGEAEIVSL